MNPQDPAPQTPSPDNLAQPISPQVQPPATPAPQVQSNPPVAVVSQPVMPTQAPLPQQPVVQPFVSDPASNSQAAFPLKKSRKKLFMGVGAGLVVLTAGLLIGWFLFWSPAARSSHAADVFVKDMTTGNVQAAEQLSSDGSSSDTKAFLEHSANTTKGHAKRIKTTYTGGVRYSLYRLDGNGYYVRVIVDKEDGKWLASSYVFGKDSLALSPGKAASVETTPKAITTTPVTTAPAATTTPASSAGACLGANDFLALNSVPVTASYDGRYSYDDSVFFKADSAAYQYPDLMTDYYAKYQQFYQANASKQFTITLTGEVNGSAEDSLANQRAVVVQQALISKSNIPASLITVGAPTNYAGSLGAGDSGSQNRAVDITIASPTSCK